MSQCHNELQTFAQLEYYHKPLTRLSQYLFSFSEFGLPQFTSNSLPQLTFLLILPLSFIFYCSLSELLKFSAILGLMLFVCFSPFQFSCLFIAPSFFQNGALVLSLFKDFRKTFSLDNCPGILS